MATAPIDPWAAAFGAAAKVATPAPAGPSGAYGNSLGGSTIDNSGWNVTFGNNSGITSDRDQTAPANVAQAAAGLMQYAPYIALAGGAVLLLKKLRR